MEEWSDPADWINTAEGTEIETARATGSLKALLGTTHCTQLIGVKLPTIKQIDNAMAVEKARVRSRGCNAQRHSQL